MTDTLIWAGVGAFGALGALARFAVGNAISARRPGAYPYGTFVVNLSGSSALGLLTGLSVGGSALVLMGAGFLGAYTTFSTWMVESRRLLGGGQWRLMWLYLLGSMLAGLLAAGLGWILGAALR